MDEKKIMERMEIALIWPKGFDPKYVMPLALGYLKSNTDAARYDVRIFDCALQGIGAESPELRQALVDFSPHVVGVST